MSKLTRHGKKRIRQRIGPKGAGAERLASEAWHEGKQQRDLSKRWKKYFDYLYAKHGPQHNRVHKGFVFVFAPFSDDDDHKLVTTFPIPSHLRSKSDPKYGRFPYPAAKGPSHTPSRKELEESIAERARVTLDEDTLFTFRPSVTFKIAEPEDQE